MFLYPSSGSLWNSLQRNIRGVYTSGPYFIKVKIILGLKFKINLIFYLIKEFMKHSCLNFFDEIVNKNYH